MTKMSKETEPQDAGVHRDDTDEARDRQHDDDTRMRDANENIRKSQGDDAGQRPTIDRHR